jgi:hypothetical protein
MLLKVSVVILARDMLNDCAKQYVAVVADIDPNPVFEATWLG